MSNNIDKASFLQGYSASIKEADLKSFFSGSTPGAASSGASLGTSLGSAAGGFLKKNLTAGGGGMRDNLWNSGKSWVGTQVADVIKTPEVQAAVDQSAEKASKSLMGKFQKEIGWDPTKGYQENLQSMTGWNPNHSWGSNIQGLLQNHPIMSAIGAGGILAGGYGLGKMTGLIGGNGAQPPPPPPGTPGSSTGPAPAYTSGYRPPQALNKSSSDLRLGDNMSVKVPDLTLPKLVGTPAMLGMKAYDLMSDGETQTPKVNEIDVSPGDPMAQKKMQEKAMQAYIQDLVRRTYNQ